MHIRSTPCLALCAAAILVSLLAGGVASAQDRLKLHSGRTVLGDLVSLEGGDVELVTPDCRLMTIPGDQVAEVRRGATLDGKILMRLKEIDPRDPKALMAVAEWAWEARGLRKDALRLFRRVVAFDPANGAARERLGHVRALGEWYADAKEAYQAVRDQMKADGYVYYKKGWIKQELLAFLKESPADWVLSQNFLWRSVAEIRKERGDELWKKEWYVGEEVKLVRTLREIERLTGDDCHAARRGPCEVYCYLGREEAQETAERQLKARTWFIETFDVAARRPALQRTPLKVDWVLSGEASFQKLLDVFRKRGMSAAQYDLCRQTQNHASGFHYYGHLGRDAWRWSLVSHMGLAMMRAYWNGPKAPAWITVASGHLAEINVMGDVRVQWVHIGAYDQEVKIPELKGHSMKEVKAAVRDYYQSNPMPGLRTLMSKDMNELNQEMDTLGTVYLLYLIENHKAAWLDFLTIAPASAKNDRERFEYHFKMTFEDMDLAFRKWLQG